MRNPLKISLKTELIPIIFVLASIVSSFYFYQNFPEQVPTHWNINGEIDDYSGKAFAAFFFPGLSAAIYVLFLVLPLLDPKKERYQEFAKPYHIFKTIMVAFMTAMYFFIGAAGLGYDVPVDKLVPAGIGILFLIIGNYLGKIKPNWFMGIRTPWTLSNEEVWNKTNRLGGKMFVAFGVIMIIGIFLPNQLFWQIFMAAIIAAVAVPIIYSYVLFKKLNK